MTGYVALQRLIKAEITTVECKHSRTTETVLYDILKRQFCRNALFKTTPYSERLLLDVNCCAA